MDVGQSTADALWQQAAGGTFKMEPEAARRCARVYVRFIEKTVNPQLKAAQLLTQLSGFGDFTSATDLQSGFSSKASQMVEALNSLKTASLTMAAAHLRAAQLIEDTESANAHAIETAIAGEQ